MSTAASLLGLPPQSRIVILHVDDVGMCHGANAAFLELFRAGAVDSGSIMVPCPWFAEIAAAARNDAALDLGVHLTLTSEWEGYRWRAISTTSQSSGLLDDDGYLPRRCRMLRAQVVPEAAEIEVRAQIDRARASGIDATHLDTHMGAALVPELLAVTLRLGREYKLPVLLPRDLGSYLDRLDLGLTQRCSFARPQYRNADSTMRASQQPLRNYLAHRAATATESEAGQRSAFLSTAIAGDGERSFAFAVMLVSTVVFVAAAPFARVPLSQLWAFIPIYQSALALNDLITAVLLFAQLGYCARARCLLSPVDTSSPLAWSLCIRSVFLVCFHRQGCSAPVPRPPPGSTCTGAPSRFS